MKISLETVVDYTRPNEAHLAPPGSIDVRALVSDAQGEWLHLTGDVISARRPSSIHAAVSAVEARALAWCSRQGLEVAHQEIRDARGGEYREEDS